MGVLKTQTSGQPDTNKKTNSTFTRVAEAAAFILFLIIAVVALAVLAVAAPLALAISALMGLFAGNRDHNDWRPAGA